MTRLELWVTRVAFIVCAGVGVWDFHTDGWVFFVLCLGLVFIWLAEWDVSRDEKALEELGGGEQF